ncbi:MAG: carbohydrate binding domain-containing protein [Chitinispirillaceae bacterium]|nr:carbohydrate binding domain-containing protein [Chitinispirillaceae bacterium]
MKRRLHNVLFMASIVPLLAFRAYSQTNLVVNGDFADDSGWNLGAYNGGEGTGTVVNGVYIISITEPGTEPWHIQFTQNLITLDSGSAYTFSYDISASIERTVEVSLANSGNYVPYSGRDTIAVDSQFRHVERTFVMRHPTDNDARLEFNCGKARGEVRIRNVRLIRYTDRFLEVATPRADALLYEGVPFTVSWSSINIDGGFRVDLSVDNGASWETVGVTTEDTGAFVWTPSPLYSPWCRIRVSSVEDSGVFTLNEGPFEIAPLREMVENGTFTSASEAWSLGVYGGAATGGIVSDTLYRIAITSSADDYWQIQLTQSNILLEEGKAYRLSFTGYAQNSTDIKVNMGMAHEPYSSYFDTTEWIVDLTTGPKRYSFLFTMKEQSDSNCRLEFNCGKSQGDVFIDEVTLVPQYVAWARPGDRIRPAAGRERKRYLLTDARSVRAGAYDNGASRTTMRLIDLKGRTVGRLCRGAAQGKTAVRAPRQAPGLYLLRRDHCLK